MQHFQKFAWQNLPSQNSSVHQGHQLIPTMYGDEIWLNAKVRSDIGIGAGTFCSITATASECSWNSFQGEVVDCFLANGRTFHHWALDDSFYSDTICTLRLRLFHTCHALLCDVPNHDVHFDLVLGELTVIIKLLEDAFAEMAYSSCGAQLFLAECKPVSIHPGSSAMFFVFCAKIEIANQGQLGSFGKVVPWLSPDARP